MAFPIIPKKRSGASGSPTSLELGELAVNTQTGQLFLGADSSTVVLLNPPTAAGTTTTERTGDGTTTAFTFTGYNGTSDNGYIVSVGGIDQPPSKYAVTSTAGGTITFVEAPTAGEIISIRALVASSGGGGGGITELTGDVTASGTGSVAATLASITTAQSEVGSGTAVPVLSVDEKGRVTQLTTIAFAGLTTTQIAGLSTTAPAALATSAVVGLSTFAARADHQHVFPTAANVGALGATASASGDLIGNYPGPTLAAITTAQSNVGSSSVVPVLSIDAKGRVTSLSTAAISSATTSAITSLTGDVVATGPGAASAALAAITTAQSEVGSATQIPVLSIDAKGRVTALRSVTASGAYSAEVLLVAGGGGGGSAGNSGTGGGGGAGGFLPESMIFTAGQPYSVTVGAGGAGAIAGTNSSIFNKIAIGGGYGGTSLTTTTSIVGGNGGSGGGGAGGGGLSGAARAAGSGTSGQGNAGGTGGTSGAPAGGGGGAAAVGGTGSTTSGGAGLSSSITGTATFYAGGGAGGTAGGTTGVGGVGGGGNIGVAGTANTGGGGGGAVPNASGAAGGSGIVIISYYGAQRGTGGTVTSAGGYTIHSFLTSGTFTA